MNELKQKHIVIHQSLVQPALLGGAEREITVLLTILAFTLFVAGKDLLSGVIAIAIWVIGMVFARHMAKIDSQALKIFVRHMRYKDYYPATDRTDNHELVIPEFKE